MSDLSQFLAELQPIKDQRKQDAWNTAQIVQGYDPHYVRKDVCGAWIKWSDYGKQIEHGWEVDHILPVSRFLNADQPVNIQALQWQNNRAKSNGVGINYCIVRAV